MKNQNLLGKANAKMIKTAKEFGVQIFNFSIPAGNDKKSGKITCPFAGSCFKFCYAKKGNYRFGNVQRGLSNRYEATKQENFVELMTKELSKIKNNKPIYIRIHDSGDFYSPAYFKKWLEIANKNLNIRFYAYTKSHSFIRGIDLPENMDLIYSLGSTKDELINQETERHSMIFESIDDMKLAGYSDASQLDLNATKWFNENNKIGLLKH
jgi:hypothetical protein